MKKIILTVVLLITYCFLTACNSGSSAREAIPDLIGISLYALDDSQIMPIDNWYNVSNQVKIKVLFSGDVDEIFFYLTPTGTETSGLREIIGYLSVYDSSSTGDIGFGYDSGSAEFIWDVPNDQFIGHLGLELINGTVARVESAVLNVANQSDGNFAETAIKQLIDSIEYSDNEFRFQVPEGYSDAGKWRIYISGRAANDDGFIAVQSYWKSPKCIYPARHI